MGWPITFLSIALAAGILAFSGITGTARGVAFGLCLLGLALAYGLYRLKRRSPEPPRA